MTTFQLCYTFIVTWFIMFFVVLPFGVKVPEEPSATHYAAAPYKVHFKKKLIINTVLAVFITGILYWLVDGRIIQIAGVYQ